MVSRKRQTKRAGSQLNRSETVTVRLDPKLNYLCELAARSQRRTKSSLIEAALVDALNIVPVDPRPAGDAVRPTISSLAEVLWHVNEVERLRRLAIFAFHLMTYDEQKIWATISGNGYFWEGHWEFYSTGQGMFRPEVNAEKLIVFRVGEHWEAIKAVANGEKPASALPQAIYIFPWEEQMRSATMAPLDNNTLPPDGEENG